MISMPTFNALFKNLDKHYHSVISCAKILIRERILYPICIHVFMNINKPIKDNRKSLVSWPKMYIYFDFSKVNQNVNTMH